MLHYLTFGLAFALALPIMASAATYEDFRFPREANTTKDGYPTPLSGKPITKTPVIVKKKGVSLKKYPEHYIPGKEPLADNEMRITVLGSGSPTPVRRAQATSGYLVELGNGDNFIFDIGPGTSGNLYSMGIHPALLDKVFIAHLHLDHCGGIRSFPMKLISVSSAPRTRASLLMTKTA
jgi:ribonuclease Z